MQSSACYRCRYFNHDEDNRPALIPCALHPNIPLGKECPDYVAEDWFLTPDQFIDRHYAAVHNDVLMRNPDQESWAAALLTISELKRLHQAAVEKALENQELVPFFVLRHFLRDSAIVWSHFLSINQFLLTHTKEI